MNLHHHHRYEITKWFFLLVSALVLYLFWQITKPFAIALLTAGVAAIVLVPVHKKLGKWIKNEKISALLLVFLTFAVVVVPLFFIAILMVQQATDIIQASLSENGWLRTFDVSEHTLFLSLPSFVQERILAIDIAGLGTGVAEWIFQNVGVLFQSTARVLFNTFLFFISLYYFLVDRERIYDQALELSPLKDRLDASIVKRITTTVRGVVFGALIVALTQGIFAAIGMTIFGVPGAILWGGIAVIAAQIPLLGIGLIMVPAVAYLFIQGSTGAAIGMLIWAVVVVGLIDNVLSPYLIEGKTKMHGLLILISILGGLKLFGSIGFIIGPTVLAALMVVIELYKAGILEKR
jgi:predicted PurR-regulated permease PerM